MNICLATNEYIPKLGGIATYYHNLAKLLVEAGHRVTVLTIGEPAPSTAKLPRLTLIYLNREVEAKSKRLGAGLRDHAGAVIQNIAFGLAMQDWLQRNHTSMGFDIIETAEYGGYGAFLLDLDLPPLLVTCHGSYGQICHHQAGQKPVDRYRLLIGLEAMLLGLADIVTAYSPMNTTAWSDYLRRDVMFIPAPWLETRIVAPLTQPAKQSDHVITGIVVGRLQNWKGPIETAAALRQCKQRGVDVRIKWIGRDTASAPNGGSMASYLSQHYADVWSTNLQWHEYLSRDETRVAQTTADFALVPSQWDTFNFTAIETLSVATPLIVSTGAGASYLIRNGENGLTVPPSDSAALAQALEEIVQNQELRSRIGQEGCRTVTQEFELSRIVTQRINAYEMAIQQRDRRRKMPYFPSVSAMVTELVMPAQTKAYSLKNFQKASLRLAKTQLRRLRSIFFL